MNIRRHLDDLLSTVLSAVCGADAPAMVAPSSRPEFGDYQANGVMPAAKAGKTNPRELAEKVIAKADLGDMVEGLEVAGPGFINIRLSSDFLAGQLDQALGDEHLGVPQAAEPATVVVDYSSPNLAKEMHVGHLRSTIIGDALAHTLEFLGHTVIRQNHVGDWGTQFGMLTEYMERRLLIPATAASEKLVIQIDDLEEFYRKAKELFDSDPEFAKAARARVVALQSGDPDTLKAWKVFVDESLRHCHQVYKQLAVTLKQEHVQGESAYNDDLPNVIADLETLGLLVESQGANCVFVEGFENKDGEPLPLIVQKSDGGYLYATTDLAAVRYRVGTLNADRILYVTDSRQALHFRQMFAVAHKAGFAPEGVSLEHVAFGTMQGADGRPFRTRDGGTVKLMGLLSQAEKRADDVVRAKNPDLPADEVERIAGIVGIGAVKYADLAHNRASDYVFSWDKMLALEGNTAPYMQYAYARIRSIFRKGGLEQLDTSATVAVAEPAERTLGLKLAQFPEAIETVASECLPHLLCSYLYDLAGAFMGFYENCPVLASDEPVRSSRLALCELTARTIGVALGLLGIGTVEQM